MQLDNDLQQFSGELQLACDPVSSTSTSTDAHAVQHEGVAADSNSSNESKHQLDR
jgi:hypothetical protein